MKQKQEQKIQGSGDVVALYHNIYRREGFEESAQTLFKLVQEAQKHYPDKKRVLYLDIEGHRNSKGGFDADIFELQKDFLLGFLMRFLTEIHGPIAAARNPKPQENDIPASLIVHDGRSDKPSA